MLINVLKSKLHNAIVTGGNINYQGSLGISRELMEAAGFIANEKILVANVENGSRLETYVIPLEEPGQIVLNGAAARLGRVGDRVIIMGFALLEYEEAKSFKPQVIVVQPGNIADN
jgi:aspartate 1-decarboxylase